MVKILDYNHCGGGFCHCGVMLKYHTTLEPVLYGQYKEMDT